jgi:hypothetical protein
MMQLMDCDHPNNIGFMTIDKAVYLIAQIALALPLITP